MYLKQQLTVGVSGTDWNSMLSFRASNSDDDLVVHLIMYLRDDYSNLYCRLLLQPDQTTNIFYLSKKVGSTNFPSKNI